MFKSKHWQSEACGWEGKEKSGWGKESLFLSHCQMAKCSVVGVCKDLKYVEEKRVLSFLLATGHPVPPLAVCRQQLISGPGRSCERKWEEIWSIWWHYKAHRWFAGFIKTWSRLHHYSWLASSSHTWSLRSELLTLSSAAPAICLTSGVPQQQSSERIFKQVRFQVFKILDNLKDKKDKALVTVVFIYTQKPDHEWVLIN